MSIPDRNDFPDRGVAFKFTLVGFLMGAAATLSWGPYAARHRPSKTGVLPIGGIGVIERSGITAALPPKGDNIGTKEASGL